MHSILRWFGDMTIESFPTVTQAINIKFYWAGLDDWLMEMYLPKFMEHNLSQVAYSALLIDIPYFRRFVANLQPNKLISDLLIELRSTTLNWCGTLEMIFDIHHHRGIHLNSD